jgi:L-amino acid N-acyltransferase YncA
VFDQIDWLNRGYITKSDVKRIIDRYKDHVSPTTANERSFPDSIEMEAMFRRFNRDKMNGKISLPEWTEQLTP